ncbi:MAG TPA: hypothetical protein DEQ47_06680, partial [Solibacterales bacterium]|nr:hypothetical protein [Bryobacterales bacterium]
MAKAWAQPMSAETFQTPIRAVPIETSVRRVATICSEYAFLTLPLRTNGPRAKRMRTTILNSNAIRSCDKVNNRMRKLRAAVFGTGFMGRTHVEGIRRQPNVEVAAVAASSEAKAREFGEQNGIETTTGDYASLLSDPSIDAVHVCTPNYLHFPMAKAALQAGKHVLCEKPLAMTVAEAQEMVDLARQKKLANCTCHNLRYYPLVQHIRALRESGELGDILAVQGTYSQDWLLYDTDYNWRIEPKESGRSRCFADIGTHWCDMIEHLTGLEITALVADMQ